MFIYIYFIFARRINVRIYIIFASSHTIINKKKQKQKQSYNPPVSLFVPLSLNRSECTSPHVIPLASAELLHSACASSRSYIFYIVHLSCFPATEEEVYKNPRAEAVTVSSSPSAHWIAFRDTKTVTEYLNENSLSKPEAVRFFSWENIAPTAAAILRKRTSWHLIRVRVNFKRDTSTRKISRDEILIFLPVTQQLSWSARTLKI